MSALYLVVLKLCSFILTVHVEDSRKTRDQKFDEKYLSLDTK